MKSNGKMKRSNVRRKSSNKLTLSVLRQIKGTLGRYLAIFAIIALGVGFFSGLRVSTDAMLKTADTYFQEKELFDFRLVSTLGLTEEDVTAFAGMEGVQKAVGSVNADFLCQESDGDVVFRAHQLTEELNRIDLVSGRMPQAGNECLLDAKFFSEEDIGTELVFSEANTEETRDMFSYDRYKVVGLTNASYYANFERGTTSLGQGKVIGFIYLLPEGFSTDFFTEIFLKIPDQGEIYSDAYTETIDEMEPAITKLLEERAALRHDSLKADAESQIADGQAKLDDGWTKYRSERANAEQELSDAQAKLASARAQLDNGWKQLADGKEELITQKANAKTLLANARKKLNRGWKQLAKGKALLSAKKAEAAKGFAAAQAELDAAAVQIAQGEAQLAQVQELYNGGEALVQGIKSAGFDFNSPGELVEALSSGGNVMLILIVNKALQGTGMTAGSFVAIWKQAEATLGAPLNSETLGALNAQLDNGRAQYAAGLAKFNKTKAAAEAAFTAADTKIANGESLLSSGETAYAEGKKTAKEAIAEGLQKLKDGEWELQNGEAEYADGLRQYEEGRAKADRAFTKAEKKLKDGEAELKEAREKLSELEAASVYVLDRTTNIGCASLESDMGIVRGVSTVFPLFFFLVAALVCLTTMTRMVDEQRTQNGVLMALGYGTGAIAGQYLFYAGSASLLGCIAGFLLGSRFLPMALWNVYKIMYAIERPVSYILDWKLFAICTAMFLFCSLGATYLVCRKDLNESAADLVRPKSPPSGKRIFLERVTFLWKRLKFLHKVSIRNILRYKKRMIMMILGVGGCTALLLTGFGIRDSIQYVVDYQFNEIELYDCSVSFMKGLNENDIQEFNDKHGADIAESSFLHMSMMDVIANKQTINNVNAVVYEENPEGFIDLHKNKEKIPWPGVGETVINYRLSEVLGLKKGDVITLRTPELREVKLTVSGIFDNYIYDYAFVQADTFREQCGYVPETRTALLKLKEGVDHHKVAASITSDKNVAMITVLADMRERVSSMLTSMNYVVLIVLVCAGALAFIVLYNLTNISINERKREIATLKVLGFYPKESAAYVFRENLILTGISALAGLPMGYALLWYVMSQIRISSFYFGCRAALLSYVLSVAITFAFAVLVAFFLYFKLEKIDMADSLKAIE